MSFVYQAQIRECILNRSLSLAMSTSVLKAFQVALVSKDTHLVFSMYGVTENCKTQVIRSNQNKFETLTHISLASFLWDIGKVVQTQIRLLIRVCTICLQNVLLKFEHTRPHTHQPLKRKLNLVLFLKSFYRGCQIAS